MRQVTSLVRSDAKIVLKHYWGTRHDGCENHVLPCKTQDHSLYTGAVF